MEFYGIFMPKNANIAELTNQIYPLTLFTTHMPMTVTNIANFYFESIQKALPFCLTETTFKFGKKYQGKVRDTYDLGDKLLLITTDRQSAFDRLLAIGSL